MQGGHSHIDHLAVRSMLVFLSLLSVALGHGGFQGRFSRPQFVSPVGPPQPPSGRSANDCITKPGPWGPCSEQCGGGVQKRQLQIVQRPSGYGAKCPTLHEETQTCNNQPCPIHCQVEQGQYGPCSATCDRGTQSKVDIIITEAKYGGRACPLEHELTSTIPCPNLPPCPVPVDCQVGYSQYSQCSAPCGGGFKTRSAFIVSEAQNGGAPCPADLSLLTDTVSCNEEPCSEPKDCEYIEGAYGECSATCGQGFRKRSIFIVSQPENGGKPCPSYSGLTQTEPCFNTPCPEHVDCVVQFSGFSQCSASCNGGTQYAQGQVVTQATAGGAPCPDYSQLSLTRSCNNHPCFQEQPRDCLVEYGEYSECSATCGYASRSRKGYIVNEAEFGGLPCPAPHTLIEQQPCDFLPPCPQPVDCKVQRAYWSECSAPCGGGSQTRAVTIVQHAQHGGHPCPSRLTETRQCNTEPCQAPPQPSPYGGNRFNLPVQKPAVNRVVNTIRNRLPVNNRVPSNTGFVFNRYGQ